MSLVSKSTLIYPDRRATSYGSQDEINFYIPPGLSLLNTKGTTLNFDLQMSGNLKKSVSMSAGVNSLFESITLYSGSGDTVYETLDSYGIKAALYYYYTKIADNSLRELHEGKPENVVFGFNSANMYCEGTAINSSTAHKKVSVHLPLYCVGCLSSLRERVFPLVATGGLRIRIVLSTSERALQVLKCPVGVAGADGVPTRDENLTINEQGGYNTYFQCEVVNGSKTVRIDRQIDANHDTGGFDNVNRALLFSVKNNLPAGGTGIYSGGVQVSHPFLIGQTVEGNVDDAPGGAGSVSKTIENIQQDNDGKIVLTLSSNSTGASEGGYRLRIDASPTVNPNEDYELSNVNMTVSYAVATPEYLEAIQRSVDNNKMVIDIDTSTSYTENISQGSLQNTMYINSVNNRAKSILAVPIKVNTQNTYLEDSYQPDQQNIKNYQFILYNVLPPNLAVVVSRFQKENGDENASFGGVAMKELSHAINAAGYPVNNLFAPWRNFAIGRALSQPGYSYNMNQAGDVRLNVNYDSSSVQSTLWYINVHHIRRINVNGNQQTVTL